MGVQRLCSQKTDYSTPIKNYSEYFNFFGFLPFLFEPPQHQLSLKIRLSDESKVSTTTQFNSWSGTQFRTIIKATA